MSKTQCLGCGAKATTVRKCTGCGSKLHMKNDREPKKGYATVIDLARMTGVTERTIHRWYREGIIPKPEAISPQGWKLWSGKQSKEILRIAQERKNK